MFFWNSKLKAENDRLRENLADLKSDLTAVLSTFTFSKPGVKNNRLLQSELANSEATIIQVKAIVEQSGNQSNQ